MADAFEDGRLDNLLEGKTLKLRQRSREEYQKPSGRIELYSSKALKDGANPLPKQLPIVKA